MADRPTTVEGVSDAELTRIREQVLAKEQEQQDYKMVHNLRPSLKEIIEREITEENLE